MYYLFYQSVNIKIISLLYFFHYISWKLAAPFFSTMKSTCNLRGSVVPVVDMRIKFGMPATQYTQDSCVIVVEVNLDGETTEIGALADSVKEVFELDPDSIEPPPRIGTRLDTEFISGMGKYKDNFIIILDINEVISAEELDLFKKANRALPGGLPDEDIFDLSEKEDSQDNYQEENPQT